MPNRRLPAPGDLGTSRRPQWGITKPGRSCRRLVLVDLPDSHTLANDIKFQHQLFHKDQYSTSINSHDFSLVLGTPERPRLTLVVHSVRWSSFAQNHLCCMSDQGFRKKSLSLVAPPATLNLYFHNR